MQTANKKLTTFLKNNPGATKEQIGAQLKMKGLQLFNLLKAEVKSGMIIVKDDTYSINETLVEVSNNETIANEAGAEVSSNKTKKNDDPAGVEETRTVKPSGRDNTKYIFEKEIYGKGKLVVAVLKKWVTDHPSTTYAQLKEVFPDTLMKRFGVFEEIKKAKEISGTRDR